MSDIEVYVQDGETRRCARLAGTPFREWLVSLAVLAEPDAPARWLADNVVLNEECWFESFDDGMTPDECWSEECRDD